MDKKSVVDPKDNNSPTYYYDGLQILSRFHFCCKISDNPLSYPIGHTCVLDTKQNPHHGAKIG